MRDKVHTEEIKVRLTEEKRARLEMLSSKNDIPVAVLARTFINKFLETGNFQAASLQTGEIKGSPAQGLGGLAIGNQSEG